MIAHALHPLAGRDDSPTVWRKYLLLSIGVCSAASSVLFIKSCTWPPLSMAAARLLLAAALLTPLGVASLRRTGRRFGWRDLLLTLPGAVFLGLHFVTWIVGVRLTTAANATLIVNLTPALLPIAMYAVMRERITRGEAVGSLIALAGVGVLTIGVGGVGAVVPGYGTSTGDFITALSLVFLVGYMVAARRFARGRPLWSYVVPLYWQAGTLCAAAALLLDRGKPVPLDWRQILIVAGLVLVPTVIGHSVLNYAMVHLRAQVVSIANLAQFILAAVFAWLLFGEVPGGRFYASAVLIVIGAIVVVRSATPLVARSIEETARDSA